MRTQHELIEVVTRRERLLSTLGTFFAGVALLLAGVGLYGVLADTVVQRRREIGIRLAIGAGPLHILRTTTAPTLAMVVAGGVAGWGSVLLIARSLGALVYDVQVTDLAIVASPCLALLGVAGLAMLRPAIAALGVDPARTLRP